MYTNFVSRLKHSLESYIGMFDFQAIYLGNDGESHLFSHIDFANFYESFLPESIGEFVKPDTLFIIGDLNYNQIPMLKAAYGQLVGEHKFVIHLKSIITNSYSNKSYFLIDDINEYIPVDLVYNKFPYDIEEIVNEFIVLKESRLKKWQI